MKQLFLEKILELTKYTLEEDSSYARKIEKNTGFDRHVLSGDARDAYIDELGTDLMLAGDEGFRPAKDGHPDEKCNPKQIYHRYSGCSPSVGKTLAIMDFDKINYDLLERLVVYIADGGSRDQELAKEGSILVFLPGMQEIMTLYDQLNSHPRLGSKSGKFLLIPLHSTLSSEEQALVFSKPKSGVRKIVISTNIAEVILLLTYRVFL